MKAAPEIDWQEIAAMYAAGATFPTLEKRYHVAYITIRAQFVALGVPIRPQGVLSSVDWSHLRADYERLGSDAAVGRLYQRSGEAVRSARRKRGIPAHPHGGRLLPIRQNSLDVAHSGEQRIPTDAALEFMALLSRHRSPGLTGVSSIEIVTGAMEAVRNVGSIGEREVRV